jgi:predicted ATPase
LALDGHTQFVLLAGEPGIGKTTLLKVFLERISAQFDAIVIQGQCVVHYGKEEAYGSLLEGIEEFGRGAGGVDIIRTFERHAPGWLLHLPEMLDATRFERVKRQTEGMAPQRMTREFCQVVEALTEKKPLIIVIEDLHWADVATIDLLASLAEHANLSLFILGTYRPADAVLYSKSLRDTVKELKGRDECHEILLELLTREDLASYLAGRLSGQASSGLIDGIHRRSDGNPLFMVKLVEELIRTQALVRRDGQWIADNQDQAFAGSIPESLHSLISRQLEALPQAQKELLEVASVVGLEFSAAAMSDALEKTTEEIDQQCETLWADGQFIEPGNIETWPDGTLTGCYRFQHHLYLEVIYQQIGEVRQARLHRKVGERIESGYAERAQEIAASLAEHFDRGHDTERCFHYRKLAAEQALSRYAYSTAIEQFGKALDKLGQLPETAERNQQEVECLILLGMSLNSIQGYSSPEVEQSFGRAMEICASLPGSELKFNALSNLATFHMSRGELAQSRRLVEQAVELANELDNPDLRLLADVVLAAHFWATGDYKNANEQAARVLMHYDSARHSKFARTYSAQNPAQACAGLDVVASLALGKFSQSLARERLVHELSAELNNPHSTGLGLSYCAMASQIRRDPLATHKYADELIELSNRYDLHWMSFALAMKGWATAQQAPGVENLEMIENCLTLYRQLGMKVLIPYCLGLLAETQRELGQIREARASVAEALSVVAQTQVGWNECQLYRLQGELLLQLGADQQDAEQSFMKSLEIARNRQNLLLELYAAVSLSQLWIEQGRAMEVPELLQPIIARFDEDSGDSDLDQARKLVLVN